MLISSLLEFASRWPDIIFDARIEILTLTNLPLDIYKRILKGDLYIYTWQASRICLQRPPGGFFFDGRIEILTLSNLPLDIHEGILKGYLYICTWMAFTISLQRPLSGQILFLMEELKF